MSWVAVAIGGSAVLGAGASVYGANKASKAAGQGRNLGGELNELNNQFTSLQDQITGGQGYTNSSLGSLGGLVNGTDMDWNAYAQTDAARRHIAESGDYYRDNGMGNWTDAQKAQNFYANGYDPGAKIPTTGGISDLSNQLNTANRTANINDVKNLASDYTNLMRGTNVDYYNQLNTFTNAANAPIVPGASQTQAADMAAKGFGTFDPSGLSANTNFTNKTVTSGNVAADQGNPLLTQLNQQAMGQGPSGLQQKQNTLANSLLDLGGGLSESDLRNIQQNSRAGFASRGLGATNASVVDETFQTDQAQRARMVQNLGIAQGIQNQGMNEQNLQNQFALGVGNQNFGYSQLGLAGQQYNNNASMAAQQANQGADLQAQQLGLQGQIANQNFGLNAFNSNLQSQTAQQGALNQSAQLFEQQRQAQLQAQLAATQAQQQGTLDPYAAILSGTNQNLLGNALNLYGTNQNSQNNLLSTIYGYGQDLNNTNYNASVSSGIAQGNQAANLGGSLLGLAGNLGGAYLKNKAT